VPFDTLPALVAGATLFGVVEWLIAMPAVQIEVNDCQDQIE
jgi:hypothetical protein